MNHSPAAESVGETIKLTRPLAHEKFEVRSAHNDIENPPSDIPTGSNPRPGVSNLHMKTNVIRGGVRGLTLLLAGVMFVVAYDVNPIYFGAMPSS